MLFGARHKIINVCVNKNQAITLRKSIMKHITLNKNVCKIYAMYQCELAPVIQTAYALKCNNLDIARRLQKLFIWHMLAR